MDTKQMGGKATGQGGAFDFRGVSTSHLVEVFEAVFLVLKGVVKVPVNAFFEGMLTDRAIRFNADVTLVVHATVAMYKYFKGITEFVAYQFRKVVNFHVRLVNV
jgi:hypothetical protein